MIEVDKPLEEIMRYMEILGFMKLNKDEGEITEAGYEMIYRFVSAKVTERIALLEKHLGNGEPVEIPNLDIAVIQELPWKVKGNKPAKQHGFGYMFCNNDRDLKPEQQEIVDSLYSAISTAKDNQVDLGAFIFKFGGENNALLNRIPKKGQESAK